MAGLLKIDRRTVIALAIAGAATGCSGDEAPGPDFGQAVVTLKPGGEPAGDVTVVFQDGEGEVIGEHRTGEDGRTGQDVPRDSMVSFFLNDHLYTIAGVQPEDVLEVTSLPGFPPDSSQMIGLVTVTAPNVAGAANYHVNVGCADGSNLNISAGVTVGLKESCLEEDGTFAVIVSAVDDAGGTLAIGSRTGVVADADGETEVPIEWDASPAILAMSYAGDHPDITQLLATIWWYRYRRVFASDQVMSDGSPIRVPHATGLADAVMVRIGVQWRDGERFGGSDVVRIDDGPIPESIAVTDQDLLPPVSGALLDMSTRARPATSWEGDTSSADGIYLQLGFQNSDGTGGVWLVSVPPGATHFRCPALPESLASHAPGTGSTLDGQSSVSAIETDNAEGYGDFRNLYTLDYWDSFYPVEGQFTTARHSGAAFY